MLGSRGESVLVVEDHPFNRALLERLLELDGYRPLGADSIAQAERILAGARPALIILDVRLPDGDGLELARRLKSQAGTAECPILACSAGGAADEHQRAVEAGCEDFISKPIDLRVFSRRVGALITSHRMRAVALR